MPHRHHVSTQLSKGTKKFNKKKHGEKKVKHTQDTNSKNTANETEKRKREDEGLKNQAKKVKNEK